LHGERCGGKVPLVLEGKIMKHESFGLTDPGRVRQDNQDAILRDEEFGLYIVCDGCGGQRSGNVASRMAAQVTDTAMRKHYSALSAFAADPSPTNRSRATATIMAAINAASEKIYKTAQEEPDKAGMGTTIVLLAVMGDQAIVAHAGDSRLYLFRQGALHQLTEDHSLANQYIKMGMMTANQAAKSRSASMITRSVGFQEQAQVDTLHFELVGGDSLLLCSDGLTLYLSDEELAEMLRKTKALQTPLQMIDLANTRGGQDNISAVVVQVEPAHTDHGQDVLNRLKVLQAVPLFRHLAYAELLRVLDLTQIATFATGTRIITEGQASDRIFVSLTGNVDVVKNSRVLTTLPPGSLFGEMGLVDEAPRSADVVAPQGARVMVIPHKEFITLLRRERGLAVKVLWGLSCVLNARLRATSEELASAGPSGPAQGSPLAELAEALKPFV
jgi:serine/threonine protein phosphatase PrpC